MAKIAAPFVLFSHATCGPISTSALLESVDACDDQAAWDMQTTLLQTKTELRDAKRHHNDKAMQSSLLTAIAEAKGKVAKQKQSVQTNKESQGSKMRTRQEACAIADATDDNTVVASLVPNNGFVCYGGTKRELDQAYCLLQTAPTRALYRAENSPWFQGDDVPADVEVQLESCESRGYEFLLHDPDDCWAPVQKYIRAGDEGDEDFAGWEIAQSQNWENYDSHYGIAPDAMNTGLFLSGCICLPGTDVMDAMEEICQEVDDMGFLPIESSLLQTETEMRDTKRAMQSSLLTAIAEAKRKVSKEAETVHMNRESQASKVRTRQEACAIADATDDNTVVASLVPNNGFVCYGGTKRELDQAYCLLQTAPTRALYRAE